MTTSWLLFFLLHSCHIIACRNSLSILLILVDGPVKDVVILESFTDKQVTEDLAEVRVVRLVIETKGTSVVQVDGKLVRKSTAKNLGWGRHLLFHDAVILLLLGSSLQSLPGEGAAAEIEHDVSKGLHVITARLFCEIVSPNLLSPGHYLLTDSQMSVDGRIAGSSRQVLILTVWNVKVRLRVTIFLCQSKVDDIDLISTLPNPHQEVVRLDITMDKRFGVNVLDTGNELIGE